MSFISTQIKNEETKIDTNAIIKNLITVLLRRKQYDLDLFQGITHMSGEYIQRLKNDMSILKDMRDLHDGRRARKTVKEYEDLLF